MEIRVPYGHSTVSAEIPDRFRVDVIEQPAAAVAATDQKAEVRRSLAAPLGNFTWTGSPPARSVAIAVNDKTRPVPHQHLLPPLMECLAELGIPDDAVTFYVAVGGHPPMHRSEFPAILPSELLRRYRVISHDSEKLQDLVFLGTTSRHTPVWINRSFVDVDLKIVVGTIEPHQFVGFSGGVKSAAIGLAGLTTINANHTLMTHPDSQVGIYSNNPARKDVEEIGRLVGVDLALNAVLDQQRAIVRALAGDPVAVMEAGVALALEGSHVTVPKASPVVVASPGGHPKDINVYQAQKAVAAATRIVSPGGTIVLTAACPEGAGSPHYEEWVAGKRSRHDVIDAFEAEGFHIGPHKAYQLARDTADARLIVFSDMPERLAMKLLLEPARSLQSAMNVALRERAPGDAIAVLPHAASTIPSLESA